MRQYIFKKRVFLSDIEINKEIKNPYVKFFKKIKKRFNKINFKKNKKKIKINKLDNDKKRINFFIHEI